MNFFFENDYDQKIVIGDHQTASDDYLLPATTCFWTHRHRTIDHTNEYSIPLLLA